MKFDKTDIRNMVVFLIVEVIALACIGGMVQANSEVQIPVSQERLEKMMDSHKLEPRVLGIPKSPVKEEEEEPKPKKNNRPDTPISKSLLNGLCLQESNNNPNALGDFRNGKPMAKGILQIWPAYVKDVNRVYGTSYTHNDMFNKEKAIDTTIKYLTHYGKRYTRLTGKQPTDEVYARIHNSGPNGWKDDGSRLSVNANKYWVRLKPKLD